MRRANMHLQGWPYSRKNKKTNKSATFELLSLKIKIEWHIQPLALIYRTPYSQHHQFSNNSFIEDFPDLITTLHNDIQKTIILWDFNIPWNKEDHMDTKLMQDTLNLFDLLQNVNCQTHIAGNILDWILTTNKSHKQSLISDIANQDFLLDHCFILL